MKVVEKVFTVCCMLHNNMLSEMETRDFDVRVGRGALLEGDGIWLRGNYRLVGGDSDREGESRALAAQWARRREQLADHIYYCAKRDKSRRTSAAST